jgi:hypothetical protein
VRVYRQILWWQRTRFECISIARFSIEKPTYILQFHPRPKAISTSSASILISLHKPSVTSKEEAKRPSSDFQPSVTTFTPQRKILFLPDFSYHSFIHALRDLKNLWSMNTHEAIQPACLNTRFWSEIEDTAAWFSVHDDGMHTPRVSLILYTEYCIPLESHLGVTQP